jgi:hypothetical protein
MKKNYQLIGLVGSSYSGSTMVSMVLGGMHGVFAIGESLWIEKYSDDDILYCEECKGNCTIISNAVRKEMNNNKRKWWELIAGASQKEIIISSDKTPMFFDKHGMPDRVILLWKEPIAWMRSVMINEGKLSKGYKELQGDSLTLFEERMRLAQKQWATHYRMVLSWVNKNCLDYISVKLEDFSLNPELSTKLLCEKIGIQYDGNALANRKVRHMIGGNSMARGVNRTTGYIQYFGNDIKPDLRWKEYFSCKQKEDINNDVELCKIKGMLLYNHI